MFCFSQNFVKTTSALQQTKKYFDAEIILDDETVHKVHKILLARQSTFFRKLFFYQEGKEYHLQMLKSTEFVQVLEWIYEVSRFDPLLTTLVQHLSCQL